jgi:MFS family permease
MLILTLGKCGGQAMAFAITGALFGYFSTDGPIIAGLEPWRATHVLLAAVTAACSVPMLILREPARHETSATGDRPPFRVILAGLWSRRVFLIPLYAGGMGVAMADTAAAIWAAPVLGRAFHLTPDQFGGWMGALVLSTGIVGAIIGGLVADWGQKRGRALFGATLGAGLSIPSALFPIMPDVTSFALVLTVFLLSGFMCGVVLAAILTVVLPNEMRGLGIGAFLALSGLVAFGLAPPAVGWIASLLGGEAHLPVALAVVGAVVSSISLICFWVAARRPI